MNRLSLILWALKITSLLSSLVLGQGVRSQNFYVDGGATRELAAAILIEAETARRDLSLDWFATELPNWREPCPITVKGLTTSGGGATSFACENGQFLGPAGMSLIGTPAKLQSDVVPHEVMHLVLAHNLGQYLPRWVDEGICTAVETDAEHKRQREVLVGCLRSGRGIPFRKMFDVRQYEQIPHINTQQGPQPDFAAFYSQGFTTVDYLLQLGGREHLIGYLQDGLQQGFDQALARYRFQSLGQFQTSWLEWCKAGFPRRESLDPAKLLATPQDIAKLTDQLEGIGTRLDRIARYQGGIVCTPQGCYPQPRSGVHMGGGSGVNIGGWQMVQPRPRQQQQTQPAGPLVDVKPKQASGGIDFSAILKSAEDRFAKLDDRVAALEKSKAKDGKPGRDGLDGAGLSLLDRLWPGAAAAIGLTAPQSLLAWFAYRAIRRRLEARSRSEASPSWEPAPLEPIRQPPVPPPCQVIKQAAAATVSPLPIKETIERNRTHYVPVKDTSTDHAWAGALAKVARAYPGCEQYLQAVERVKDLILSGEEDPHV